MRQLIATVILCAIAFGCAATPIKETRNTGRPKQSYLVIRAPNTVLGDVDPAQFRIVLRVTMWNDHPIFSRHYYVYCGVRDDSFECIAPLEDANLEFEIRAIWLQPDPANLKPEQEAELRAAWDEVLNGKDDNRYSPEKFCDEVSVGVSVGHFGWIGGGNAGADRWMKLAAKREPFCQYEVPYNFIVGSKK